MSAFQAIILAGGSGMRLYPLTEETPKSLLLVNKRPLLWYQLHLLESSGYVEVLVVTIADMLPALQDYVSREYEGKIHIEWCQVTENIETADALREIADKIKTDFIVLAGDLVTDVVVHHATDAHRLQNASVTMLLQHTPRPVANKKGKTEKPRRDKDMTDCIGLVEQEHRVVLLSRCVHMTNDDVSIPKALTHRKPRITLHTDLYDGHFYIFAHWVLDLIVEKKYIASIKDDLIPHLVRRQFRGPSALPEDIRSKAQNRQRLAASLSSSPQEEDADDLVRCFAHILPSNAYCERADTIPAYQAMDQEVKSRLRITPLRAASN